MDTPSTPGTHLSWMDGVSLAGIPALAVAIANVLPTVLTVLATIVGLIWYTMMIIDWVGARKIRRAQATAADIITTAHLVAAQVVAAAVPVAAKLVATAEVVAKDLKES